MGEYKKNYLSKLQAKKQMDAGLSLMTSISGKYHELSAPEQEKFDRRISSEIIDEAIGTLTEIRNKRLEGNVEYKELIKSFGMLVDMHRKMEGKDKVQNNVQINLSLSDLIRKSDEKIVEIKEIKQD